MPSSPAGVIARTSLSALRLSKTGLSRPEISLSFVFVPVAVIDSDDRQSTDNTDMRLLT